MAKRVYAPHEGYDTPVRIKSIFNAIKGRSGMHPDDLDVILEVALCDYRLFPNIKLAADEFNIEGYIFRWMKGYYDAMNNPPSQRVATEKSACSDPAIALIVQETQRYDQREISLSEYAHNLFMSAENIQGNLLEEFIAFNIRRFGFLWCAGNTLRAVDFCREDGGVLLQIKNKSNTENSSSSNIREGTEIEKWYRLGTRKLHGRPIPSYRWNQLNEIVNTYGNQRGLCDLREEDYQDWLIEVARNNPAIISGN